MMDVARWAACRIAIHRFARDYESTYPTTVKSLVTDIFRFLTRF
jgi:hypothetical protein